MSLAINNKLEAKVRFVACCRKIDVLERLGIEIAERAPLQMPANRGRTSDIFSRTPLKANATARG